MLVRLALILLMLAPRHMLTVRAVVLEDTQVRWQLHVMSVQLVNMPPTTPKMTVVDK
jgi:hypothetical protein